MSIREYFGGTANVVSSEEVIELTNQFYVTLRAYFAKVKQSPVRNQEAFDRVAQLLDTTTAQNWTNAYEIEQLLVHLFDDPTVATELGIRIIEARSVLRPELAALYDTQLRDLEKAPAAGQPATPSVEDRRRTLLGRLVNDLQWRYIVNEATRRFSKSITRSTAALFVIALLSFLTAIGFIYWNGVKFSASGDLRLVGVAALAGAWGATFSMLVTLKSRLAESKFDDLKLMRVFAVLFSRALIGAGAACILFFFLLSGLLGGTAFPTLTPPPTNAKPSATSQSPGPASPATAPTPPTTTATPSPATTAPQTLPSGGSRPATGTTTSPAPSTGGTTTPAGATAAPPPAWARAPTGDTPASSPASTGGSSLSVGASSQPPPSTGTNPPAPAPSPQQAPSGTLAIENDSELLKPMLAMLIVWCFIAGFSEQLIPGLLASTESRANSGGPSTPDRFRPARGNESVPPAPGSQGAGGQGAGAQGGAAQGGAAQGGAAQAAAQGAPGRAAAGGGSQSAGTSGTGGPAGAQSGTGTGTTTP